MPPPYAKGHVRSPIKDHLIALKARRHQAIFGRLLALPAPPVWDSRAKGWVGPIKNQKQCGCHDSQTEVLTEKGWARWEDYDWLTALGTMSPVTGALEFQSPLARHVCDYDGPMYYSDNRCVDFALTPNHRMYLRKWDEANRTLEENYRFAEVRNMGWYAGLPHATTGWGGTELKSVSVGGRTYGGDDFLSLVAAVISCGWAGDSESTKNTVSFCCFRDDRQELLRSLAGQVGMREQPSRRGVWSVTDGALAEWFRQNTGTGVAYRAPFKRVPSIVKVADRRQVELFLRHFGDQHTEPDGARRFYSSSPFMIDDLQELLLRIGRRGTVEERPPRQAVFRGRTIRSNGPDLTLTERRTDRLSLDRKRHLRTDHYKGKVYCATVPNGLLVTRRNKRILISGNSCWNFSGTGMVEVAYYVAGLFPPDGSCALSEQYTLDCGKNGGCNGDDNVTVLEWAKSTGLPKTSDYGPYDARSDRCAFKQSETLYKIDDWGFCDPNSPNGVASTDSIKAAIMQYGCVGAGVAAGGDSFWDSGTGVGTGHSSSIDHDVIIVGWDDSKGSGGAWLMRNSWDTSWGDKCANAANPSPVEAGYAWVQYGAYDLGDEAVWCVVHAANPPIDWGTVTP